MQRRLHYATAAFLTVIVVSGAASARGDDSDARTKLYARQQIREELVTAMSDGQLSHREQYRILLHAQKSLSPDDLQGLQRTMDRLAASGEAARVSGQEGKVIWTSAPTASEETNVTGLITEDREGAGMKGSPFHDEVMGDPSQFYDDGCGFGGLMDSDATIMERMGMLGRKTWANVNLFSSVDAFKGPLDLDNTNGNFGVRAGITGAVPLSRQLGIGLQGGASETFADFHGIPLPEPSARNRTQTFTTAGLFQRVPIGCGGGGINWGFAYDWLFDDYYSNMKFGQWRVQIGFQLSRWNELGCWAAIHDHGDTANLHFVQGDQELVTFEHFRPINQMNVYWRHSWCNGADLTGHFGTATEPGEFVFGADGRVPISSHLAVFGNFNYILPSASGGLAGQSEEFWYVSVGIEFVPGGARHCPVHSFTPLLPLADNGNFAIRRLTQ